MSKLPSFQFYPGDWFREPGLRASSISAKGAWAQILFSMHDAKERGKLTGDLEYWGRLIGVNAWGEYEEHGSYSTTPWDIETDSNTDTALSLLRELVRNGVCEIEFKDDISESIFNCVTDLLPNVTVRNCVITIINRRMYREFLEAEKNRIKQQKYRDRQSCKNVTEHSDEKITNQNNQKVTSLSSSSSSSSDNKTTPLTPLGGLDGGDTDQSAVEVVEPSIQDLIKDVENQIQPRPDEIVFKGSTFQIPRQNFLTWMDLAKLTEFQLTTLLDRIDRETASKGGELKFPLAYIGKMLVNMIGEHNLESFIAGNKGKADPMRKLIVKP